MEFIDTHCHLNDPKLMADISGVLARARSAGVKIMHVVGYDVPSSKQAIALSERYEEIFAIVGIHPTEIKDDFDADFKIIETLARHPRVIAIGETGLDYYWEKDPLKHQRQIEAFKQHINLANKVGLPVVVHSRDAIQATLETLVEHPPLHQGVMHCYSGSKELVPSFIEAGMYISLAGPVTFLNARVPKEVAAVVPQQRLLIETDSPYLAPQPHRGKQNEPSLLPLIAEAIAKTRGWTLEETSKATTANAIKLFHVKQL